MGHAKIVHYLALVSAIAVAPGAVAAESMERFDARPLLRQVQANVSTVQALEAPARNSGHPSVLRCVTERIRESRVLLNEITQLAAAMGPESVQVAQVGNLPLDVPASGVPEITVMVAGVKSVSESSALISAARRCFAISEDSEIRWLPAVQTPPVSSISALSPLR